MLHINYVSLIDKIYIWNTCEHTSSTIYLYARRLKRSTSLMLRNILALMILVKSKGNWTVKCMCTWVLNAYVLVFLHALLISCLHVFLLWHSYALTSIGLYDHMLLRSHLTKFTYFYVHILCWSYTFMFPCFDNCMLQCQHVLKRTYSLAYMLECSYAWTLLWLDAPMLRYFFDDHIFWWSHTPTPTRYNDYMPPCSLNFTVIPFVVLIIICSYIQMLW